MNVTWHHPGGKLRRLGPTACSQEELLSIIIGSGYKGKSALDISREIIEKYGSINNLMGTTLRDLVSVKGLKSIRATKIAATFEIARRIIKELEKI